MSSYYFYDDTEGVPFKYLSPTKSVGQIPPPYETDMSPSAYLEFAINDLDEDSKRGLVNAFGNSKRAFHLAVDTLLHQYGLFAHHAKANFPTKLEILDRVGILPITMIKNLNVERNILEHEYSTPSKKRVEEVVDITRLIILATEKLLEETPHEVLVGWSSPSRHALIQIHPQIGELHIYTLTAPNCYKRIHGVSCISRNIRNFDGKYTKRIKVSKNPWKTIKLSKNNRSTWSPIIREFVSIQRKENSRRSFINKEKAEITMPVTIPMSLPDGHTWHELLDSVMGERFSESKSAKKKA